MLVRQRTSPDAISKEGDWYWDAEVGVILLHSDTWATMLAATATLTLSYSYYDAAPATGHRHIHFDGPAKPGDFVAYDEQSNFVVASAAQVDAGLEVVGRVHEVQVEPARLLSSVKTAFNHAGVSATSQMPGSATKGFSDLITLSEEVVADQLAIVTVRV